MSDFNTRFIDFLKKTCKNSCVMLADTGKYSARKFYHLQDFRESYMERAVQDWRSVGVCTADATMVAANFIKYAQAMKDNYVPEFQNIDLPEPGSQIDARKIIAMTATYGMAGAVASSEVFYKPVIMVDFDIKDARKLLLKKHLIDQFEHDELEQGNGPRSKYLIHDMPEERIRNIIKEIFDFDTLIKETSPMMILFTGGGVHIWYALTVKTDAFRYKTVHDSIRAKISEIWPELTADGAASNINQLLRLPGSYNVKPLRGLFPVQTIYEAEQFETPQWILDIHNNLQPGQVSKSRTTLRKTGAAGYSENSLIYNLIAGKQNRAKYRAGLRNLKRDPRLWAMVKKYLTFETICDYTQTQIENLTVYNSDAPAPDPNDIYASAHSDTYSVDQEKDPYYICSSPLRKDHNPSFMVFPRAMICRDLGRHNLEYDYGELMFALLIQAKERLGMDPTTSRYEASYHCALCSYMAYSQKTGKNLLPMLDREEHQKYITMMEKAGAVFTPNEKKIPAAKGYYANMQGAFREQLNYLSKNTASTHEEFLKFLIHTSPAVYYYYDPSQAAAGAYYLANALALSIIYFINRLHLGVQKRHGAFSKYQIYAVNKHGIHQTWETLIPVQTMAGADDDKSEIVVHNFLVASNITEGGHLPSGTPTLSKYIDRNISQLDNFHLRLDRYLADCELSEHTVKIAMCDLINDTFPLVRVTPSDINVSMLNNEHYIEFDNRMVLYHSTDTSRIGTVIKKTKMSRLQLMQESVVDLRIKHMYDERGGDTPLFDKYMASMTYAGNCFDKCMHYFFGSMLYYPEGQTKAILVLGRNGDNGKSALALMITKLLGHEHVTKKNIEDITSASDRGKNTRVGLVNSMVNITMDAPRSKIEDMFKGMVEGEAVQIRELYAKEQEVELRTHYLINANTLPGTWGETLPLIKRLLVTKVFRKIAPKDIILNIGSKIADLEAHLIWPKILTFARTYREKGMAGFLTQEEIVSLQKDFLLDNDLWVFINDYVIYDPTQNWQIRQTAFKRLYNRYRQYNNKNMVKSDNIVDEAEVFLKEKYRGTIPEEILEKGFEYRTSERRGFPVRIYVPEGVIGNTRDIDSEKERG